ncbi:MAG: ferric reductase-like transmembrane domain-containing protein [Rhizobacter sp.]|nr:ferric reductase-like transmembrane domain-containing protein [Ferruginibacter sp.]
MSASYQPVLWNKFKKQYDAILWGVIILYLTIFIGITISKYPTQNINTTLIRAFGTLAILLLHVILIVGPLSRLSNTFLPILYNRRHLGVSMFIIALVHSLLSLLQFHGNGNVHPIISLFTSNLHYNSLVFFPFQTLGFFALIILAAMAFTSHDFWLHFLGPKFWKVMHMLVYVAYGLILLHVALGIIQFEKSPVLVALLITGFISVAGLHLWAAVKENKTDRKQSDTLDEGWNYVCTLADIEDDKAKMVNVNKERVAIFKYDGKLSAVHNVCKHQMGPLGEGKVIDGCITCPWHGYQYRPEDGCAPAPFTEKVATYQLQLRDNKIYVNTAALPEGTFIEPVIIADKIHQEKLTPFFIGWARNNKMVFNTTRLTAFVASIFILIIGVVLSNHQQRLSDFIIDYNNVKKMEGWLSVKPVPNLKIIDGKDGYGNPVFKTILLMDAFKFGADAVVKKVLDGDIVKYVRLTGYLSSNIIGCSDSSKDCIEICSQCIIGTTNNPVMEIENGQYSFEAIQAPVAANANITSLGLQTLRGEIIDPKCYFGAMNPGQGKPHLSCAVRCISGGIMPVLKYEVNNQNKYAVLVGLNSEKINNKVLNFIGLPVEITGELSAMDNWGILKVDPKNDLALLNKY